MLAKRRLFYPLLFAILKKKNYLDRKFDGLVTAYSRRHKDFFFVQIGANDGIKADPIYLYTNKYKWNGLLVEPVRYLFDKLKANYKDTPNLAFENAAISEKDGFRDFYRLKRMDGNNAPLWHDEIGSFLKETVLKHKDKIKDFDKYLITDKVRCLSLKSLFKRHNVKKIDLLQIDTEGYDYNILKQIPFNKIKPSIINYEDRHLSQQQKEYCEKLLKKQGYTLIRLLDNVAYLKERF